MTHESFTLQAGDRVTIGISGIGTSGALVNSNTGAAASVAGTVTLNDTSTGVGGAGNTTLAGLVTGSGGLTKWGEGTLTLSGSATYGGVTSIQAGTLRAQNPAVLVSSTLQSNNSASSAAFDMATPGTYSTGFLLLGQILRVGTSGTGPATLAAASGMLNGNIDKVLEVGSNATVLVSGTFDLRNTGTATRNLVVGGAGNAVFNGIVSGTSTINPALQYGITIGGSATTPVGMTTLNAANTYNGPTTVTTGTLRLGNARALGSTSAGTLVTTSTLTPSLAGGVLDLNGQAIVGEALTLNGAAGTVSLVNSSAGATASWSTDIAVGGSVAVGGAGGISLPGNLSGTASLTKIGAGRVTLAGNNPLTGSTTVQQGTLQLANGAALASSRVIPLAGGTLALTPYLQTTVGGLAPNAGGLTDVGSGMVTVAAGLSAADMVTAIVTGLGDGSWNGASGITSSVAATSGGDRTVGWLDNGDGTVTFAFAAAGDTNLDWQVDIIDAANFLAGGKFDTGSPASWNEGDFTYDGVVDILDAASFLSNGLFDAGSYNPPAGQAGAIAAVPEPSALALVLGAVAAAGIAIRSRRPRG